jgi:hypothetical protein
LSKEQPKGQDSGENEVQTNVGFGNDFDFLNRRDAEAQSFLFKKNLLCASASLR